jgi:small GTP-binding protein
LIELRMLVEATLDFPDEELDFLESTDAFGRLDRLQQRLTLVFERAQQGHLLQGGLNVVLAGQPNVGKSSLLNRLAGDELAIVTPLPGTTRDLVRSTLQVEGIPLHVIDTAGLRATDDQIEQMGIERTWREIERADVVVLLVDARTGLGEADRAILSQLPAHLARLTVYNKIDLAAPPVDSQPMAMLPRLPCPPKPARVWSCCAGSCCALLAGILPKTSSSPANAICARSPKPAAALRSGASACRNWNCSPRNSGWLSRR